MSGEGYRFASSSNKIALKTSRPPFLFSLSRSPSLLLASLFTSSYPDANRHRCSRANYAPRTMIYLTKANSRLRQNLQLTRGRQYKQARTESASANRNSFKFSCKLFVSRNSKSRFNERRRRHHVISRPRADLGISTKKPQYQRQ